jgi:pilus assembly protein CpaB
LKRANRLMLVFGVVLAAVAFVAVLAFANLGQQAPAQVPDVNIVVAATDLGLGTALTADVLATATRPAGDAADTFSRPEDVVGRIVRRSVPAGQALTSADFVTNVDYEVTQSLRPGQRAMAVPLSRVDSVGALLQAGDYVDVLLALEENDALNPIVVNNPNAGHTSLDGAVADPYISIDTYINNTTVKVVVQNVQVLATVQRATDEGNNVDPAALGPEVVVILAVTPQQSEVIRFAQLDGNVSLVLRAPADSSAADTSTTGITLKWLVDHYGVLPPAAVTP